MQTLLPYIILSEARRAKSKDLQCAYKNTEILSKFAGCNKKERYETNIACIIGNRSGPAYGGFLRKQKEKH